MTHQTTPPIPLAAERRAQTDTRAWVNLELQWIKSHRIKIGVDAEPKILVSAPPGDPDWATIDVTPSIVAESPPVGSRPHVWSVEAGFVLPLGVSTQIDVWVSRRVAGAPDDWLVGAGFVRRLR